MNYRTTLHLWIKAKDLMYRLQQYYRQPGGKYAPTAKGNTYAISLRLMCIVRRSRATAVPFSQQTIRSKLHTTYAAQNTHAQDQRTSQQQPNQSINQPTHWSSNQHINNFTSYRMPAADLTECLPTPSTFRLLADAANLPIPINSLLRVNIPLRPSPLGKQHRRILPGSITKTDQRTFFKGAIQRDS